MANWSEVLQNAKQHGAPVGIVGRLLASFGLKVVDVTSADAWAELEGRPHVVIIR
jgi:hypothetical protein